MPNKSTIILKHLKKSKKKKLLRYLEAAMDVMDQVQFDDVFGALLVDLSIKPLRPKQVLKAMQTFLADSLAGKYYAPFDINSKNFMDIPEETEMWFRELSVWLDRSCELVEEGHPKIAKQCLDIGMELVERMGNGEDIVFADEYGDWMITAAYDYKAIYQQLK